jgi:hypothetical protein
MQSIHLRKFAAAAVLLFGSFAVQAQSCGFVGLRSIKSYWVEGGVGLIVVPVQTFDNPTACTKFDQAFVLTSNPQYKQILASAMLSLSTGTPMQAYACGCQSYWGGQTWPIITSFGVGGSPQ